MGDIYKCLWPFQEIAIGRAAPSPIEIEQAILVIAFTNEGMTARSAISRVITRDLLVKITLQHLRPMLRGIAVLLYKGGLGRIREIGGHPFRDICRVGATSGRMVTHVHRHTTMIHQGSHSHLLFLG